MDLRKIRQYKCYEYKAHAPFCPIIRLDNCGNSPLMLNLLAMFFLWILFKLGMVLSGLPWFQQPVPEDPLVIQSPSTGDALQGIAAITGKVRKEEITAYEVSFSYQRDQVGVWFLISKGNQPDKDGYLALWDTNAIADGLYRIRVLGLKPDGKPVEVIIQNIRVRNYTPIETNTPTPSSIAAFENTPTIETMVVKKTLRPTPTILPVNPAVITFENIRISIQWGVGGAVFILALLLGYLWLIKR